MSETITTNEAVVLEPRHYTLRQLLFPSVVSGVVLGVVGAVVVYFIVRALQPDNYDAQVVFAYTGWTLFFFAGIGAFNGIWRRGFARHDDTLEEALDLAGKDQGLWRYFRYTTDHKVVGMQYLATVLLLFFVGSMVAFSIRPQQAVPRPIFFTPPTFNPILGIHGILMIVASIVMVSGPF